jgi:hypothetical protein
VRLQLGPARARATTGDDAALAPAEL